MVVGRAGQCGTVIIGGMPFDPAVDRRLMVIYAPCAPTIELHSTHCLVLLQVKDSESGAAVDMVEIESNGWKQPSYSDSRGKILLRVPFGTATPLVIKSEGYHFAMVGVGCSIGSNRSDRLVALTRK